MTCNKRNKRKQEKGGDGHYLPCLLVLFACGKSAFERITGCLSVDSPLAVFAGASLHTPTPAKRTCWGALWPGITQGLNPNAIIYPSNNLLFLFREVGVRKRLEGPSGAFSRHFDTCNSLPYV